jgi:hypothetical protein
VIASGTRNTSFGIPVAGVEDARAGLQALDRVGDPPRLRDVVDGQREGQREAEPLGQVLGVVAVLEQLDEVRVPARVEVEERRGGLPPGGHRDVEGLLACLGEGRDAQRVEPAVRPVGRVLLGRAHEHRLDPVVQLELARVLDDDADAAGELDVLEQERDLHALAC